MQALSYKKSIKTKILGIVLLSIFIITALLGYLSYDFSKRRLTSMLSESIRGIAATTASFIKAEDILLVLLYSDKIKEKYMSMSSVTFSHIYEKMEGGQKNVQEDRFNEAMGVCVKYKDILTNIKKMNMIDTPINIYAMGKNGLSLVLTTENTILTGANYNLRPESEKAIFTNLAQSTGIYTDKDGVWISAYAPIPSVYSEKDKMLVEISYKIDAYIYRLRKELGIIILVCLIGFLVTAFMSYKLVSALVSDVQKLDKAAKEFE